ncbi:MAG: LysM peptidoglycan-binding domain-containing protein [Bacteroidota bacterium]
MQGQLVKLKIIACSDPKFEQETGDVFETLVNPDEFQENYAVEYEEAQASGTSGSDLKFKRIKPQTLDINLLFDGMGIIQNDGSGPAGQGNASIVDQIDSFKKVAMDYQGETHAPRYVKISWGTLLFKGRLTSLNLAYTVFKPDGTPIRAKGKASFKESKENEARVAEEDSSSPDLTHLRIVHEGDRLPLMCHKIYGDHSLYRQVADFNGIDDFRNLEVGSEIKFPPINQSV